MPACYLSLPARYIGRLPGMDPRTDDTYLDWMSRFLFSFVDSSVGKMTKNLIRKQSCVLAYTKVWRRLPTIRTVEDILVRVLLDRGVGVGALCVCLCACVPVCLWRMHLYCVAYLHVSRQVCT